MDTGKWEKLQVHGRDEVLRDIQKRANAYSETVVKDVRAVMHDYEVDMYRLVLSIGKHYGMDKAYEIMSETVADKRLRWVKQVKTELNLTGTEIEKGLELYRKYFRLTDDSFQILEQTKEPLMKKKTDIAQWFYFPSWSRSKPFLNHIDSTKNLTAGWSLPSKMSFVLCLPEFCSKMDMM